jgi:hypothetical protein
MFFFHGEIPYVPLFPPVHCAGRHPKSSETMTTSLDADSESLVVFFRVKPWDFTIEIKDLAMKIWDLIVKT